MAVYNEADFVMQGREVKDPEIAKDGLELYYDVKGKKNGDVHKNKLLDMSGQGKDGELSGFDYDGELSGYDGDNGLIFDGIDDKLVRADVEGIDADNFTYQLNNNILAFTGDEVKTVKNGDIEVGSRNHFVVSNMNPRQPLVGTQRYYTFKVEPNQLHTLSVYGTTSGSSFRVDGVYVHYSEARDGYQFSSNSDGIVTIDFWQDQDLQFKNGTAKIKLEKGNTATDWTLAPEDLIETTELKGNILGDMEDIVDASPRDRQSGKEVFTEHADDSHVHVEVDGQSYQHTGSGKNLFNKRMLADREKYIPGLYYTSPVLQLKPNTVYVMSAKEVKPAPDESHLLLNLMDATNGTPLYGDSDYGSSIIKRIFDISDKGVNNLSQTFTTPDSGMISFSYFNSIYHQPQEGYWFTDVMIEPQLEEGSTATEYEPPAPTPDYPIEIESLNDFDVVSQKSEGGENLILHSDRQPEINHSKEVAWSHFENNTWKEIM